jgi:hypothetical protein
MGKRYNVEFIQTTPLTEDLVGKVSVRVSELLKVLPFENNANSKHQEYLECSTWL